jgi:hypothetical protein
MTTKPKQVDYNQAEKAIELSEKWFELSESLYVAKVDPQKTKGFFKSSRAAGRAYIVIDTANKTITLTDDMLGAENFKSVSAAAVTKAAGLIEEEETAAPAAVKETAKKPAAAKKTTKKPAKQANKPVQPNGLQFGPGLVSDKEGKITIASLLHAGKAFASRAVPAEFAARFEKYSEDNKLLLYLQGGPALGQVSTYRGWLKQGRQVTKGQHGLKILAPRMVVKEDGTKAIDGLRLVTLFSVNQTEKVKEA